MSFATVFSRTAIGLLAPEVEVEVHLSGGLPSLTMVGLPEAAVRESKDRVRSAILNSGFNFPQRRITINLAPADIPKEGARLDLPIALGILAASEQISPDCLLDAEFAGELALDGELRKIQGALSLSRAVGVAGRSLFLPDANAEEAARIQKTCVYGVKSLRQLIDHLQGVTVLTRVKPAALPLSAQTAMPDLADVKGQFRAKRALEIAAAGGHSILFQGPPGTGKTLIASRLISILPSLSDDEALEVASIYSIAGVPYEFGIRPFRAPHHTASAAALVGGGSQPKPGEITLAHHGVLFLDELPEFDRKVLEVLRQPLESQEVVISRAARQVTYPARFQLIAAMNPCPCGYYSDPSGRCTCTQDMITRYRAKLSGPLLDRMDLHLEVPAIPLSDLQQKQPSESSSWVRERVIAAHQLQLKRQGVCNQKLSTQQLDELVDLGETEKEMMRVAQTKMGLSARAYHRILRVARTIADLANAPTVTTTHLSEALSYRGLLKQ